MILVELREWDSCVKDKSMLSDHQLIGSSSLDSHNWVSFLLSPCDHHMSQINIELAFGYSLL